MLRHLDLFAGAVGGFTRAAHAVGGIKTIAAVEYDPWRRSVFNHNFPEVTLYDDIRTYNPTPGEFDLITGGSPCIDLSCAGKRAGIIEGERSSLWWEMLRIVDRVQPSFVVWENVAGAISNGLREVLGSLRMVGYTCEDPQIVSAQEVGAPHLRERVFVIAYSNSFVDRCGGKIQRPWSSTIGSQIEAVANLSFQQSIFDRQYQKPNFPPFVEGMDDGDSTWLDEYNRQGWWLDNPPPTNVLVDRGACVDRIKRMSALGDAVTPQQAAIPLIQVLEQCEEQKKHGPTKS